MSRGRIPQNVNRVPVKLSKPIKLKDKIVKADTPKKLAGICLTEFAQVFLCFRRYNFNEEPCAKELSTFQNCYNSHLMQYKATKESDGKKKINELLRKYY